MNSGITLELPAPVSTLAFGSSQDQLYIGADDGSIRLYELPSTKVTKAGRNLPEAVTAIAIESPKKKEEGVRRIWAASADQVNYTILFDGANLFTWCSRSTSSISTQTSL
jgi:WD40 repeat protein